MKEKRDAGARRGVVLADPALFVYQFHDPVEGISAAEAEEAARLAFEEESPHPPEEIGSGLWRDPEGRIGLFGCERAKLPACGEDGFLVPAFLPFLGWERGDGAVEVADTGQGFALLVFARGGTVPSDAVGFARSEGAEGPPWEEIAEAASFLGLPRPAPETTPVLSLEEAAADSRGRFAARIVDGEGRSREWTAGAETLWSADLRPAEEIERLRSEKASGERIWLFARIAAGFLAFTVLAQALAWILGLVVAQREERSESLAPAVRAIEERAALASRLGDLGKSRLSVFRRLGELNLLRPQGVQFLTVEFTEPDRFQMEGRVSEVRVLNDYIRKLEADPRFRIVEAPTPRSRDGRIEFELGVRVAPGEIAEAQQSVAADRAGGGGGA